MTPKKPEKSEKERTLTAEEKRMCDELSAQDFRTEEEKKQETKEKGKKPQTTGEKIVDQFKDSGKNIKDKTLREIHEIAKDPNRTAKNEYKWLMKAVANGRIYIEGDQGLYLLNALVDTIEKGEDAPESKELHEKLRKIDGGSNAEFINSKAKAKKETKKLRRIEEIDEEKTGEQKIEDIGARAKIITETGETGAKAEALIETPETNWEMEQPSQELLDKLREAMEKEYKLTKEYNEIYEKLKTEEKKKTPDPAYKNLQKRAVEIHEEVNKLRLETAKAREKYENHLTKALSRFRAIKYLSQRVGFDTNTAKKLNVWAIGASQKAESEEALKGIVVDEATGKAAKKRQHITIDRLFYEKEKSELITDEAPGQLMVEYTDTKAGKPVKLQSSCRNFIALLDALEGFEECESPEEFNEKYGYELGYKDVRELEGEKFSGRDEDFKVEKVYEKNGKWYVVLGQTAIKIKRQLLQDSVDPSIYFDRKQKEFELGEFGTFLRRNDFQRGFSIEEMQEIVNGGLEADRKECASFAQGMTPEQKRLFETIGGIPGDTVTIPKENEVMKTVYTDPNGYTYPAELRRIGDEYEITYDAKGKGKLPGISDPPSLSPEVLAGAELAKKTEPSRVRKIKLNQRQLMDAANKGQVQDAPPTEEGQPIPAEIPAEIPVEPGTTEPIPLEEGEQPQYEPPSEQTSGEPTEGAEKGELKKPSYHKEALAYSDIHKVGNMQRVEQSWLKSFWTNSRFMSVNDVWEMGKAMWEYYARRWERRQKEKYSSAGKELPFWAPEMQRINQAAENEEMGQFKESFEQKGVYEIIERLERTGTRDELKAALVVLNEKGQMRWDNIEFWKNLNKFVDPSLAIPIPSNGDPNTEVSDKDPRTGFAFLKDAIDSLWGEGTYNNWYSQNKSSYQSNAKGFYEEGKELEGVEGGPGRKLAELLKLHKEGRYVDPHEYEGLILFSLEYGKAAMQEKIYYMIEGVAAQNMYGRTILSFDRMAHISSEMLPKFPMLEYFCAKVQREEGIIHAFTIDDYRRWVGWFDEGSPNNFIPTKAVDDFMWEYALPNDHTQKRINKDMRNAENLDHDDMFAFLPPASTGVITDACKSSSGSKKFLTIEGYANAFPGFSQYFKSLSENNHRDKLTEAIRSYVRYEGIMTDKYEKARTTAQDNYQRMDETVLNNSTIVSAESPNLFIGELNKAVQEVTAAYGNEELNRVTDIIFNSQPVRDISSKEGQERQNEINQAYYKFEEIFKGIMESDGGNKMTTIIGGAGLRGMKYTTPAEKAQRKQEKASK